VNPTGSTVWPCFCAIDIGSVVASVDEQTLLQHPITKVRDGRSRQKQNVWLLPALYAAGRCFVAVCCLLCAALLACYRWVYVVGCAVCCLQVPAPMLPGNYESSNLACVIGDNLRSVVVQVRNLWAKRVHIVCEVRANCVQIVCKVSMKYIMPTGLAQKCLPASDSSRLLPCSQTLMICHQLSNTEPIELQCWLAVALGLHACFAI
jgi:hypothetical protein